MVEIKFKLLHFISFQIMIFLMVLFRGVIYMTPFSIKNGNNGVFFFNNNVIL